MTGEARYVKSLMAIIKSKFNLLFCSLNKLFELEVTLTYTDHAILCEESYITYNHYFFLSLLEEKHRTLVVILFLVLSFKLSYVDGVICRSGCIKKERMSRSNHHSIYSFLKIYQNEKVENKKNYFSFY